HLMILPGLLRSKIPNAKIGFFLHIPFPPSEIFRILPWRGDILRGLLGADLIGFHTFAYLRNFTTGVLKIMGLETFNDGFSYNGRFSKTGVFPISIDVEDFIESSNDKAITEIANNYKKDGRKLILGIDRMDYTKGISRRFLAVERFFEKFPEYIGKVRFIQVGVPTRDEVESYIKFRKKVYELVGLINGKFSTAEYTPINFINRSISKSELVALYKAADIMLVTPIRDGMNLVAKEYIACKDDLEGVLILSEYAGAVTELAEAIIVNPFDVDNVANSIKEGLEMSKVEKISRMENLHNRVVVYDMNKWGKSFLEDLESSYERNEKVENYVSPEEIIKDIQTKKFDKIIILSDFDGTLIGFKNNPDDVIPDEELIELINEISDNPLFEFHILSGRPKTYMEKQLNFQKIYLHSDHGLFTKVPEEDWKLNYQLDVGWKENLKSLLEKFANITPGSFVEEKIAGLVWHYRNSDSEISAHQLREMKLHILQMFSNLPVKLVQGNKALEVRLQGVSKSNIAMDVFNNKGENTLLISMGDDHSDAEIYELLEGKLTFIAVGGMISKSDFRLWDYFEVRKFLKHLLR
ncbi:MAG: bifunctional alpha,alpha-trehalose-phosphate synthase (UDP-forming)/trehalose-phosphatase, partial [Leptospiraceae bacterium]|nr:bifunctional alpha,alpha-trehalose-phosphate synthase (UDP-forming)/trehalose-phosphatase [Leptospiraceae bacterium]